MKHNQLSLSPYIIDAVYPWVMPKLSEVEIRLLIYKLTPNLSHLEHMLPQTSLFHRADGYVHTQVTEQLSISNLPEPITQNICHFQTWQS